MTTTTIRVDRETHARLVQLGDEAGTSLIDTVRAATEALRRQRFGARVATQLAELQADPEAWADYVAEGDSTEVADGIDR